MPKERTWFHPVVLMFPFFILVGLITHSWKVLLLLAIGELLSTSWHTSQHHPNSILASKWIKVLTITGLIVTALLIYKFGM